MIFRRAQLLLVDISLFLLEQKRWSPGDEVDFCAGQ